jgi:hypothetical protein
VDQVGQTPGRVGKGAGRPARVWGSSARALVAMHLHEEMKPKSVEATPPGQPATTWHQTDLSKSVVVPFSPINTPPHGESRVTTLYLLFSTCKGSSLVVVAQAKLYHELRVESSRVFARALEIVLEIGELLYPYLSL